MHAKLKRVIVKPAKSHAAAIRESSLDLGHPATASRYLSPNPSFGLSSNLNHRIKYAAKLIKSGNYSA